MRGAAAALIATGVFASAAGARTVPVSGVVARSCIGPIPVGRPPTCFDRAVFVSGRRRTVVHGRFRVRLRRGTYVVTVDTCEHQQTLVVKRAISGLSLVPHCAIPLAAGRGPR